MPLNRMLINYVPGEECRVAIVSDGKLEELHAERLNAISHVGNIYVGRVVNVEPAIQAAFIDFGLEHNGFLHISDLHPQYFPGGDSDRTEQVGKKTPRRNRPPIQEALRRGQEITVQVLKEGIGTKGPTLTSYLSIPGRFLVMMPDMDKVGVSRKVEDEELRRAMRQILDQLELPDGFGFILRTAGMDRTKAELKRDLAYLQRLWKDMERRRKMGNKPRLLYAESDLLVRALRDVLTAEINEVVIDDLSALRRAARFMKIISPRSSTKLLEYDRPTPIFHAFGVEEQIQRIHSREVPLPSGGSLVIDETEALVAIDVNSGKMRSHGDAETTAYRTNIEAVDEICRQLRLRDLGGLVINDLIDMRSRAHQRDIEQRFRNNLKKDRARSKILSISQFGIIEMTRQRMRGSVRSMHFAACPSCSGRGLVQRPDSVANDAMRELACILQHERVHRVEMVVSPRVAGELLSSKRQRLGRLERLANKQVHVRVSETIPVDRTVFYAYDDRGADIEVDKLPMPKPPTDLPSWDEPGAAEASGDWAVDPLVETPEPQEPEPEPVVEETVEGSLDLMEIDDAEAESELATTEGGRKKRRRRRRGRGRDRDEAGAPTEQAPAQGGAAPSAEQPRAAEGAGAEEGGERRGRRRRRRRRKGQGAGAETGAPTGSPPPTPARAERQPDLPARADDAGEGGPQDGGRRRRRRRRRRRGGAGEPAQMNGSSSAAPPPLDADHAGPRGDSWDLDPSAVTPARQIAPDPVDEEEPEVVEGDPPHTARSLDVPAPDPGARGDSWDLAPSEVTPVKRAGAAIEEKPITDPPSDEDAAGDPAKSAPKRRTKRSAKRVAKSGGRTSKAATKKSASRSGRSRGGKGGAAKGGGGE